jgi:hypothetical protein
VGKIQQALLDVIGRQIHELQSLELVGLLLGGFFLLLVLLLDVLEVSVVADGLDDSEVVLERLGDEVLIDGLCDFVLVLEFLDVLSVVLGLLGVLVLVLDLDVEEEVEEALLLDLLGLLLAALLLVLLLDDLDGDVLALLPGHLVAGALLDDLVVQLELLVQLGVAEPLVLAEVEVHPQLLQVRTLPRLHPQQVLQQRLVPLLHLLAHHIAVREHLQPELGDLLRSEVVVLVLLLLLRQQLADLLEVRVGEGVLSGDDVVDLSGEGVEAFAEGALDGLDLALELAVQAPLLDQVAVESDRLHLLGQRRQRLDLGLDLGLDVDLLLLAVAAVLRAVVGTLLRLFLGLLVLASHQQSKLIYNP